MGDETSLNGKSEIASLTAKLLRTGTLTRSKKQIADELDRIKTEISIFGSAGGLVVRLNTDKTNLPAALALLDDMLHHPKFDAAEFEKVKLDTRADYEANRSEPSNLASVQLAKKTSKYPKGHPSYAADTDESLAEIAAIKLEDVKKYYNDFYGANNSIASFVGEIDQNTVLGFLEKSLGKWNSKLPYKEIVPKYFDVPGQTVSMNTPDKTNAALMGSINIPVSEKHADYPAIFMANELLGGGAFLSSRIPQRLREKEGMSYGAGTYVGTDYKYEAGSWGVYAFFNPLYRGKLDSALHEEIGRARKDGFTQDELQKSVASWLQQNKTILGLNSALANILRTYLRDGRDLDEFTAFEEKIKALDLASVNAALRKYFDESKLTLIYAGDFKNAAAPTSTKQEKKPF